jgi:hypothetical protein
LFAIFLSFNRQFLARFVSKELAPQPMSQIREQDVFPVAAGFAVRHVAKGQYAIHGQ